jgi:hypothetical protein
MTYINKLRGHTLILTYFFQFICSSLFALRLYDEWGTDYGIYYVGAISSQQPEFGLYADFFDFKGPLYYGFLRILSFLISYNFFGAVLSLLITCMFWFTSINLATYLIVRDFRHRSIMGFASIAILIGQGSNSSLSLFQSGFIVLSLSFLYRFVNTNNRRDLYFSYALAALSFLVKADSLPLFIFIPIFALIFSKKVKYLDLLFGVAFSFLFSLVSLLILSRLLHFKFHEYFYHAIIYVAEARWSLGNGATLKNFIIRDYYSIPLLLGSGIIFALILVWSYSNFKILIKSPSFVVLLFGAFSYGLLQSDKNYHLFVFYPYALIALVIGVISLSNFSHFKVLFFVFFTSASVVSVNYLLDSKCIVTKTVVCSDPYKELRMPNSEKKFLEKSFYLNQGWPFLINEVLPKINFTIWWPLAVETKNSTTQIIEQANSSNFPIWVDYNDFIDLQKRNPLRVSEFMKGKELVRNGLNTKWAQLVPID